MFGIFMAGIATFFVELGASIGKYEISKKREDIYTMAFLNHLGGFILMTALIIWEWKFQFSLLSLPLWGVQMVSEALHIWFSGKATVLADRSTWGFLRMGTVPLLLIVDAVIGYNIQPLQYVGIVLIIFTLYLLYKKDGFSRQGIGWVIAATINAAVAISLYKYSITYYNSVAAHHFVSGVFVMTFITWLCRKHNHPHPVTLLKDKVMFSQFASVAFGSIIDSFSYLFAPASIIVTAKRCASALFTILAGNFYFHEGRFAVKLAALLILCVGMVFLLFQ